MANKFIKRKEWLNLVAQEIEAIRQNSDAIEKLALTSSTFNPESANGCIYGQMTGHCRSNRAIELIMLCCKGFIINFGFLPLDKDRTAHEEINVYENFNFGEKKNVYYSSLESYIFASPKEINYQILAYIKGHTDKLPELI